MSHQTKRPYVTPSSTTVTIRTSGVLCESPDAVMNIKYLEETI